MVNYQEPLDTYQMAKKEPEEYEMPKKEAIAEHRRLIKVLYSANEKLQKAEAKRQEKELKKILAYKED